jgi:hypothetical protein
MLPGCKEGEEIAGSNLEQSEGAMASKKHQEEHLSYGDV